VPTDSSGETTLFSRVTLVVELWRCAGHFIDFGWSESVLLSRTLRSFAV
jgi:hypothetical protein